MISGHTTEVSLRDVFADAENIRRLTGNPLEVAALMRLLLAIGLQVCNPKNDDEWIAAWKDRHAIVAGMAQYVADHAESFDLYDPNRPFSQHPKLTPGTKPLAVLEYDRAQGNNPVFLDASTEAAVLPIPSGAAARALLVNLSFGGSHPDKSNPLSSGKENTMYAGPLCARLIAIVEGEDLCKTLILNLVVGKRAGPPSWIRAIPNKPGKAESDGPSDLYTRLTRFVRLLPSEDGQFARSVALHMGEQVAGDEDIPSDPMIPMYLSRSDKKYKVLRLEPGKALWRSAGVLLCTRDREDAKPIRALAQLAPHVAFGDFPRSEKVGLRVVGVAGNAQGPKTELWRDESLPFDLSIVTDEQKFNEALRAIELAESEGSALRKRVYGFAMRYLQGAIPNPDKGDVAKLADELAPDLYDYWSAIAPRGESLAIAPVDELEWAAFVKKSAQTAFDIAMNRLPPSARRFHAECSRNIDDATRSSIRKEKITS